MTSKPNIDFFEMTKKSLENSKAQNIMTLDLFGKSSLCDYMFIATATSARHANSIVENLKKEFKNIGMKHINREGKDNSNWMILDIGDIIVHVFQEEAREHYKLEELWDNPKSKE